MSFECQKCGSEYIILAEGAGKWIICPSCNTKKLIPGRVSMDVRLEEYKNVFEKTGSALAEMVKKSGANCIILIAKAADAQKIILKVAKDDMTETRMVEVGPPLGTIAQVRLVIRRAVDEGLLNEGDSIMVLVDERLGVGFEGMLLFFRIDKKFMELTETELKKEVKKSVYEAALEIAREIGKEGREGRKIGTPFIIGDHENVLRQSRQMILNPFEGHPLEKRNLTDVGFKETLKALAQLDGAFVIDENGYVHSGGRYLDAQADGIELPGLGCRHLAAAAMTKTTSAIAVCVSESGGVVRVFRNGILVLEEKP